LFLGGRWIETHAEATCYLASVPFFELGSHSYLHPHMRAQSAAAVRDEMVRTQRALWACTGRYARAFRPPYGEWDEHVARAAAAAGMYSVIWSVSTGDPDPHATVADLMAEFRKAKPGDVVIMHANGRGWRTAQALPRMLEWLKAKGLRPVTMAQLLRAGRPVAIWTPGIGSRRRGAATSQPGRPTALGAIPACRASHSSCGSRRILSTSGPPFSARAKASA
jgi:peptidoglycan/xylan/chitin deacetylase (PgdA/CDA1 family)